MQEITPLNITRVKNINNPNGEAYLDLDPSVVNTFKLHWPNSRKANIAEIKMGEVIALYQKYKGKNYLTHLVTPLSLTEINKGSNKKYQYGLEVHLLAYTGGSEETKYAIPLEKTLLGKLNRHNKGWGSAELITSLTKKSNSSITYSQIQGDLWNRFKPFLTKFGKSWTTK